MPWKMEEDQIAVQDGNPVFVHPDGKEVPFDAEKSLAKINELNTESASRRRALNDLEKRFSPFAEIEDPTEFISTAQSAIETVKNLDDKKLIDAGEVETVRNEITKAMQAKIDEANEGRSSALALLNDEMIGGRFSRSKFIKEQVASNYFPDVMKKVFGDHFKIEDGKVVAYDSDSKPIYSQENPGDHAGFDEALEMLINAHPYKEQMLKAPDASGGDSPHHRESSQTGIRSRADLKGPAEKAAYITKHGLEKFTALPETG